MGLTGGHIKVKLLPLVLRAIIFGVVSGSIVSACQNVPDVETTNRRGGKPEASISGGTASASDCQRLIDRLIRCIPGYGQNKRDQLIQKCSDASSAAEMSVMMQCARKADCTSFKTCLEDSEEQSQKLSRERRMLARIADLRTAMSEKRWKEARDTCQLYSDEKHEEFENLCEDVRRGYRDWLFVDLRSQRDSLKVKSDYYGRCLDLKDMAKADSQELAAEAGDLCLEVDTAKRVQRARTEIAASLREGRGRVPYECGSATKELEKLSSDWAKMTLKVIRKECEEDLPKQLVQDHVDDLAHMRDTGDTKDGFTKCFDLKRLVKSLSEEEQEKATALCNEVEAADDLKQALADTERAVLNKVAKVPFKCAWALKKLEGLTASDWAKKQVSKLARECYVEVGHFVLTAHVEDMRDCEFNVRKVLAAVAKYELSDPLIDGLVADAKEKCP